MKDKDDISIPGTNFTWSKGPVKYLGINISLNKQESLNYECQLHKLKTIFDIWSQRVLPLLARWLLSNP
jgi:hypothetical protein